ncbi:MAG: putative enoyl-CoA hydratase/isomerase [Actinomycetes bacterium]|nr:MAG: putative enoyl-CoA hydratase/isomerase [Actinomycetes bacterium]
MSVRRERDGAIMVVTIDRPEKRNALSLEMSRRLAEAWTELRDDPGLRVAVLTGAGTEAFCAGADLSEVGAWYRSMTPIERRRHGEREPGLGGLTRNLDPGKPVLAAVNGACLAGGLELALACDLRIAAEHATFGLPEVGWGLIPGAGGTQRLPRAVPQALAMEMLLGGDPIDAATALRSGLVSRTVPGERLTAAALELAGRIAANAPLAVQTARAAARAGSHLGLDEALALEQLHAEPLRGSEDVQEGLRAFAERREPRFEGR